MAGGKPFTKGTSGNPGGRKRGVERLFQDAIGELEHGDKKGFAALMKRLSDVAFEGAHRDSVAAIKLLLERAYGYPRQEVELTGDGATAAPAPAAFDWSKVPIDLRRQLLAVMREQEPDDGTPTEH